MYGEDFNGREILTKNYSRPVSGQFQSRALEYILLSQIFVCEGRHQYPRYNLKRSFPDFTMYVTLR